MRLFLKIGILLLLLVALALGVVLIPSHLQIRSVNTPIPSASDFAQLQRSDGPTAMYYVITSQQQLPDSVLSHSTFVLEWADGSLFLIDAGMRKDRAIEFGKLMETALGASEAVALGDIGTLLGSNVARVAGVGFTHLHIDHTEAVDTLCSGGSAKPVLLQTSLQREQHNTFTREGADIVQNTCLTPGEVNGGTILTSERFPGLGLVAVGGHTPGSTLFAAWLGDHLYLMSGDITNSKRELNEDLGKGWIYSNLLVTEDTERTAQLRQWLRTLAERPDTTVVVSHDLADIRESGLRPFPTD